MQFIYCPECGQIQPRRWYGSRRCPSCLAEGRVIKVKMSVFGYTASIISILALVLAVLYYMDYGTFLAGNITYAILLCLFLAFALLFVEMGKAQRKAEEMVIAPRK